MFKPLRALLMVTFGCVLVFLLARCGPSGPGLSEADIRATIQAEFNGTATVEAINTAAAAPVKNAEATAAAIQATVNAQSTVLARPAAPTQAPPPPTQAPPPPPPAQPTAAPQYIVEISNVDDEAILYVNGKQVMQLAKSQGKPNPSGRIDITPYLHPGENKLRLVVNNSSYFGVGGWSYSISVLRDGSIVWQKAQASSPGDDPDGQVADVSYTIQY